MTRRQFSFPAEIVMTRTLAAELVQKAASFESHIVISYGSRIANAKSLLGLLSLYTSSRTDLTLIADGPDEDAAADALVSMITSGFRV